MRRWAGVVACLVVAVCLPLIADAGARELREPPAWLLFRLFLGLNVSPSQPILSRLRHSAARCRGSLNTCLSARDGVQLGR